MAYAFSTVLLPAIDRVETMENISIQYPIENDIQLDIDREENLEHCKEMVKLYNGLSQEKVNLNIVPSRSGKPGHYHVTISFAFLISTDLERSLLQAIFGSDLKREMFNWWRWKQLGKSDSCFFEFKGEEE